LTANMILIKRGMKLIRLTAKLASGFTSMLKVELESKPVAGLLSTRKYIYRSRTNNRLPPNQNKTMRPKESR